MRWILIPLLTLLGVIVLTAVALSIVAAYPRVLIPAGAWVTERFLDRTLTIDGAVTLDLSLKPRLSVEKARFGNAPWSAHPDMVRADYAMVQIDLLDLFDSQVHFLDLDFRNAEVWLEDPADGQPNWSFGESDDDDAADEDWSLIIEGLTVNESVVHALIGDLTPMVIEIPQLTEETDPSGNLVLLGSGKLNDYPWQLKGSVGSFAALLAAGQVTMDLDIGVGSTALGARGSIGNLGTLEAVDLTLDIHGPDGTLIGELFGLPALFRRDVALEARVEPAGNAQNVSINGHISEFEVAVAVSVANLQELDGWQGSVDISGPDSAVIARALQINRIPGGPFRARGRMQQQGTRLALQDVDVTTARASLQMDATFPDFPHRQGAKAHLQLTGGDISEFSGLLRLPGLPRAPFQGDLTLDGASSTEAFKLTAAMGDHTLTATGTLGDYPEFSGSRLATTLKGSDVAEIIRLAGLDIDLKGSYQVSATLALDATTGLTASDLDVDLADYRVTGTLVVPDVRTGIPLNIDGRLQIADLSLAGSQLGAPSLPAVPFDASVRGAWRRSGLHIDQGKGKLGDITYEIEGDLGALPAIDGVDLTIFAAGPNVRELFGNALPESATNVPFQFSGRIRSADKALELIGLKLTAEGGELDVEGQVGTAPQAVGTRITLRGHGAHLNRLLPELPDYRPPDEPWSINGTIAVPDPRQLHVDSGQLTVGSIHASASGTLDLQKESGTDLSLDVRGDSLRELGQYRDIVLPPQPFDFGIDLEGTPRAISISRLEAHLGESDLTAQGSVDVEAKPRVVLKGSSSVLKLDELQNAIFGALEDQPSQTADRIVPDLPIPLEALQSRDWEVAVTVKQFSGRRVNLEDVDLAFKVQDGVLTLDRARYKNDKGSYDASFTVRPAQTRPDQADVELHITADNADLGVFVSLDQPPETRPRYDLDIDIAGSGATLPELFGSLNGTLLVSSKNGGRIDNQVVNTYGGDFVTTVLDTLNPFSKNEPYTTVECMVLNAAIDDGMVNLKPGFVMRTHRLNMFVLGSANLAQETLNLSLVTHARQGIGISAATITNPYFKIGGTLANPKLQLDPESAALAAGVATATAGLSIVVRGVWSRLRGETNPCPQFLDYQRGTEK